MLPSLTLLLACQLAGELAVRLAGLPVPGPVVGMALLLAGLAVRGSVPEALARTADGLLAHLSLLFVPAGVGVMLLLPRLEREGPGLLLAVSLSTVSTIVVTAVAMRLLLKWTDRRAPDAAPEGEP
ncbi:MAG: CidA/LrgA family protein [Alphaproteobacteria bacterium]|nr:CidA/LrgA family protein [Alphaproteobacteria bacterium]